MWLGTDGWTAPCLCCRKTIRSDLADAGEGHTPEGGMTDDGVSPDNLCIQENTWSGSAVFNGYIWWYVACPWHHGSRPGTGQRIVACSLTQIYTQPSCCRCDGDGVCGVSESKLLGRLSAYSILAYKVTQPNGQIATPDAQ